MEKFKAILVWLKNLLSPLTLKAAIVFLEKKGYCVCKKEECKAQK